MKLYFACVFSKVNFSSDSFCCTDFSGVVHSDALTRAVLCQAWHSQADRECPGNVPPPFLDNNIEPKESPREPDEAKLLSKADKFP